ncbi:MAG TPA: ABC transporter ATP-binding protein [Bacteroidales bacterium]|nr:ABC transporter ATP-binding protein [Bacteroidales bacterium]
MTNTINNILSLHNLSIGYSAGKNGILCERLNVGARKGELIALIGKNGTGKSTLLRTIARLQASLAGSVTIRDREIYQFSGRDFARLVSFVSTENVTVPNMSVYDLVALGRFPYTNWIGRLSEEDRNIVEHSIKQTGLALLKDKNIDSLSDGERQRVMIARTLAQNTDLIILDEPTAFLDLQGRHEIIHLLNKLAAEQKKTIVFSTHDLNIATSEADKIWMLLPGELVEGAPEDLILNNQIKRLFDNSLLRFDSASGSFVVKKQSGAKFSIMGEGEGLLWTSRALQRLGLTITETPAQAHGIIRVNQNAESFNWQVHHDDISEEFASVYLLANYLKEHFSFHLRKKQ